MNKDKAASSLGKKRWKGVGKQERSEKMKKVRGSFDMSNIKLKSKPQDLKTDILKEMSNGTEKGLEYAVLFSLSDGNSRTKKEIQQLVERIYMVSALELLRRDGIMEVSDNFDWFTNWTVKQKKMKCVFCDYVWDLGKGEKLKECPNCGLDLIALAKNMLENKG